MTPSRRRLRRAFKEPSMLAGGIKLYGPGKGKSYYYKKIRELMAHYGETNPKWRQGRYDPEMAPAKTFAVRSPMTTARGQVEQAKRDASIPPCAGQYPAVER